MGILFYMETKCISQIRDRDGKTKSNLKILNIEVKQRQTNVLNSNTKIYHFGSEMS